MINKEGAIKNKQKQLNNRSPVIMSIIILILIREIQI
jgi:hypothetical protein